MIKVANIRTCKVGEYCGRANSRMSLKGSVLANPYPMNGEGSRDSVCDQYQHYFDEKVMSGNEEFIAELGRLERIALNGDLTLLCWCAPKRCHCDTIKRYLEARIR